MLVPISLCYMPYSNEALKKQKLVNYSPKHKKLFNYSRRGKQEFALQIHFNLEG